MPTVIRIGPYRFFFYASDHDEPIHIHVQRDRFTVKYWLNPVKLAKIDGFNAPELKKIEKLVIDNKDLIEKKWNEFFSS